MTEEKEELTVTQASSDKARETFLGYVDFAALAGVKRDELESPTRPAPPAQPEVDTMNESACMRLLERTHEE